MSSGSPSAATAPAEKQRLRAQALARRDAAFAADPGAGERLASALWQLPLPAGAVVSAYWPMRGELDPRPAMAALANVGHRICLPVMEGRDRPLRFRAWLPGTVLEPARFGTREPPASAAELTPSVLLVPLVAYDDAGYRLGYGGGFYDRTLAALRAAGPVLAVGVAYAAQRLERVPRETTDERLDWIVTEAGARAFGTPERHSGTHS